MAGRRRICGEGKRCGRKETDMAGRGKIWQEGERYGGKEKDMAGRRKNGVSKYVPTYS